MDDLWATLDNHQPFSTEHGRTLRSRRFSERAVMSELRLWLLRDYAAAYCRSLAETRIFRRCYWIDGLGVDAKTATTDTINRSLQEASDQKSQEAPLIPPANDAIASEQRHLGNDAVASTAAQ